MKTKRIYFDTMLWMYFLEGHAVFNPKVTDLLKIIRAGRHPLFASPVVIAELIVLPRRDRDVFREAAYKRLFRQPWINVHNDFSGIVDPFAEVRAFSRFAPIDSLHLSVASTIPVDLFVTEDKQLLGGRVNGIDQICSTQEAITLLQTTTHSGAL